jgi:hypothetical protein
MAADIYTIPTQESMLADWLYYMSYSVDETKDGMIYSPAMGMYIPQDEFNELELRDVKSFAELDLLQLEEDEEF